ncbi:MAG: hypothetical protein N4A31_03325 [Rickettsiales bacterium]|jgi:hypothetical protein|nr:hypothetical protein [Rickettsiales bacterium]
MSLKIKNVQNIIGTKFNDVLLGNDRNNLISGGDGDDIINARGGVNTIYGGSGNDKFVITQSSDNVTVMDFELSNLKEKLNFIAFGPDIVDVSHLFITEVNNSSVIKITEEITSPIIYLPGVQADRLNNSNFLFFKQSLQFPTVVPSVIPTLETTVMVETFYPSSHPTTLPSIISIGSPIPTFLPSSVPSKFVPVESPSPTVLPTEIATVANSELPNSLPTSLPSFSPTEYPYVVVGIITGGKHNGTVEKENFIINVTSSVEITSGGGEDLFTILPHASVNITITDFNQSSQVIDLRPFTNIFSINDINITSGSVIVHLPEEQKIRLLYLVPSDIKFDNFVFYSTQHPTRAPTQTPTEISAEYHPTESPTQIIPMPSRVPSVATPIFTSNPTLEKIDSGESENQDAFNAIIVSVTGVLTAILCISLGYIFKSKLKEIFRNDNKIIPVDEVEEFFDVESVEACEDVREEMDLVGEIE